MTSVQDLSNQADLAFAAYSTLVPGSTNAPANLSALGRSGEGLPLKQAQEFALRYPGVIAQVNDATSGFSMTVFRDAGGGIALALRGSEPQLQDWLPTNTNIVINGAGYQQIVALYNAWQRLIHRQGEAITVYRVDLSDPVNPVVGETVLDDLGTATASLVSPSAVVDVSGHSLGGHLALAFAGLFASNAREVYAFNAPGFIDSVQNRAFFGALGGVVPTGVSPNGVSTVNVIADAQAGPTVSISLVAGMHSRPGLAFDVAIENQAPPTDETDVDLTTMNHGMRVLTDSLAVYSLLSKLDPQLGAADYEALLHAAAQGTADSLEGIVDALNRLLTTSRTPLPVGNNQREALYQAIYNLDNAIPAQMRGEVQVALGVADLAAAARTDFSAMTSLLTLAPLVLIPRSDLGKQQLETRLASLYSSEYAAWQADQALTEAQRSAGQASFSNQWYSDRMAMRNVLVQANAIDEGFVNDTSVNEVTVYEDKASNTLVLRQPGGPGPYPTRNVIFGVSTNNTPQTLTGANANDSLYGGDRVDILIGNGGDDYLEGRRRRRTAWWCRQRHPRRWAG